MSDETVKQDAEALADVKKRRGRPRKQKSMENETKESTVETQDMEASAGTQEKKVFKISRTPKIKIKKKDTIPLQGQEEGVDEGPAPEVEGFVHPLEDTREEQMELPLAPEKAEGEESSQEEAAEPSESKEEEMSSQEEAQDSSQDGRDESSEGRKKSDRYERYKNKKNGKKREDYPMEVNLEENPDAPKLFLSVLTTKHIDQLREQARGMGINEDVILDSRKTDLIYRMCRLHSQQGGALLVEGVLDIIQEGAYGYLRYAVNNYLPGGEDVYVSAPIIKATGLKTGDTVYGQIRAPRDGEKAAAMIKVFKVNGEEPKMAKLRAPFDSLTPLFPDERLHLEVASTYRKDGSDAEDSQCDLDQPS